MPDRPGTLAGVAGIFGELGINIVSAVAGPRHPAREPGAGPRCGLPRGHYGPQGGRGETRSAPATSSGRRDHERPGRRRP